MTSVNAGSRRPHLHEEWQFGVSDIPATLSLGPYRRHDVQVYHVTVVHPFEWHSEAGGAGTRVQWQMLYVPPATVNRLCCGRAAHFQSPVIADGAAAGTLRALLQRSADGSIDGPAFAQRVSNWLGAFIKRHAREYQGLALVPTVEPAGTDLKSRPTQSATFREIGAMAGVTISHLVRSFSRAAGIARKRSASGGGT